jgi:hypothetical protein
LVVAAALDVLEVADELLALALLDMSSSSSIGRSW